MNARIAKAREWLLAAHAVTAEDRNMQLLGLCWADADATTLKKLRRRDPGAQQPDGAWPQHDGVAADAYATGQSLVRAREGRRVLAVRPAYQRGVNYLLATQNANGSWRVASRAPKFQAYFNSGFPYGGDQWISAWATGWATMALAQAAPINRVIVSVTIEEIVAIPESLRLFVYSIPAFVGGARATRICSACAWACTAVAPAIVRR